MSITDVNIVRNMVTFGEKGLIDRDQLIDERLHLDEDLWIGPLDRQLVSDIMDACEPAGENFKTVRQFHSRYAIVRENTFVPRGSELTWDSDGRIGLVISMSRLVYPTSIGYEYAARIEILPDGKRRIIPALRQGFGNVAYVVEPGYDRLTKKHVPQIAELVAKYNNVTLPDRVKSALFYFDYASCTYYVDIRWPMLVTAAESLIHVNDERDPFKPWKYSGSTRVFVDRMLGIQSKVGALGFTKENLRAIYYERSGLAHGQDFTGLDVIRKDLYLKLENGMRAVLRKAVIDGAFAATFVDVSTLQKELPLLSMD